MATASNKSSAPGVFRKMLKIQAATRSLAPNAEGQTGAARYHYVAGAKVLGIVRPLMDSLGLLLSQEILDITNTPISYMTRSGEKMEMFTTIHLRFTWTDTEDGSSVSHEFYANGMNAFDKGLGSALTYAERYYIMKTFHIATDEDDIDALVKEEAIAPTPAAEKPASKPAKKADPAPVQEAPAPADPNGYKPLPVQQYWGVVRAYVEGRKTADGKDYRSAWIEATHAGKDEVESFDLDCRTYASQLNQ